MPQRPRPYALLMSAAAFFRVDMIERRRPRFEQSALPVPQKTPRIRQQRRIHALHNGKKRIRHRLKANISHDHLARWIADGRMNSTRALPPLPKTMHPAGIILVCRPFLPELFVRDKERRLFHRIEEIEREST